MKNSKIIFDKKENAILLSEELEKKEPAPDEILLKTEYSLISPGTELSIYKGMEHWAPLPFNPGYASIGKVESLGENVKDVAVGDTLLSYSPHRKYSMISDKAVFIKLPPDHNPQEVLFTRLAAISITALRTSNVELGDRVAVFGMGLIGNLAAQLFQAAGAEVTAVDICPDRLERARECGIKYTLNPKEEKLEKKLNGLEATIEATGTPGVVLDALKAAGKNGETILLGSPRGEFNADLTELLKQVHLWNNGCVSLKGAHEWKYPRNPSENSKHNIKRNCKIIAKMITEGNLSIKPLLTHALPPSEAQTAYQGLLHQNKDYLGVVFDWRNI